MYALSQVVHPDELVQIAFDSLRERICVLDRDGSIVLTNQAWSQSARENGASPDRCGLRVNYLRVCRIATGPFSERGLEAAMGIETVLRGAAPHFNLDYPCPSPSRKAWFRLIARPLRRPHGGAVILHSEITSQVLLAEKLRRTQAPFRRLLENPGGAAPRAGAGGKISFQGPRTGGLSGIPARGPVGHSIF